LFVGLDIVLLINYKNKEGEFIMLGFSIGLLLGMIIGEIKNKFFDF